MIACEWLERYVDIIGSQRLFTELLRSMLVPVRLNHA